MRLVLAFALALVACSQRTEDGSGSGPPDDVDPGSAAECARDSECAAAAQKCCDCPSFAVSTSDPAYRACEAVQCPTQTCSSNVAAVCRVGACTLACVPMQCPTSCALGYATAADGCLTCDCAAAPADACATDDDCAETRADCCGCQEGGTDTAVLASQVNGFDGALQCPADPACPGTNACIAGAVPRCIEGSCSLTAAAPPGGACGRADLPACPAGQTCTVNTDPAADMFGVGLCE
ncbi:MAG TPA: hypothetical protein VGM88_01810 [Kofleriaceae bacterium]